MNVAVKINDDMIKIDETFSGASADEVVGKMKARVARELGLIMRSVVNSMENLAFAQEVVKQLNQKQKLNLPIPLSCEEFLLQASYQGYAIISE